MAAVLWLLAVTLLPLCYGGRLSVSTQKLEIQNHLKQLNKPPLKSFNSPDGDIIDCVHISSQPAFDHPLLKNHTVQMMPNYRPQGGLFGDSKAVKRKSSKPMTQMWHSNGRCPKGTIPIRRTQGQDLLRASSVKSYGKKQQRTIPQPPKPAAPEPSFISQSGHQHAIAYVDNDKYYGAKATMNVWTPRIEQPNEFSLSQVWILGGSFDSDLNSIEAGWQVSPDLYGDNNTRLFTYWTSDAYQATGCYNLLCSGFVQISNEVALGASISPISSYDANQYDITILVWKDPKEGNWWMQFGKDQVLGYWPAMLFSYLSDSASVVEWGGEVVNSQSDGQHTTTQMGSGRFPGEGFGKSSYFRNIQVVDGNNNLRVPKDVTTFTEQSTCYDVRLGKNDDWGSFFYYGGPGRNPDCP
ncbi:uncharacterized protein LOC127787447 [Diospyros lotus]|uniref:uncharacterized protein LOC127787447 n=1 Tax=Diospyros lotus TaxID=55363 RepID=UPI002259DEF2|nr:uncharacterized protein LOC127787447 [Diospyros lotus]